MVLPTKRLQGQEKIKQIEHHDRAGAQSTTPAILAPGKLITDDLSVAPGVAVGKGSLIRIKVAGDTYIQFSDNAITGAPGAATEDALLVDASINGGWHIIRSTGAMMRVSTNPSRAENLGQ